MLRIELLRSLLPLLLFASSSQAATCTWKAGAVGDWFDAMNWTEGRVPSAGDDVVIGGAKSVVKLSRSTPALRSLVLGQTLVIGSWDTLLTTGSMTVQAGGVVTLDQPFKAKAAANRVRIDCAGKLTIEAGGAINVDGKGYSGGIGRAKDDDATSAGFGPGAGGYPKVWGASPGGSHGGKGGTKSAVAVYDSAEAPEEPGSGGGSGNGVGGGHGGGAIHITAGQVVADGSISASGSNGLTNTYGGGGSGGSIFIRCETLTGRGTVSAEGGAGSIYGGGGGGGRIAVIYSTKAQERLAQPSAVQFSAVGGANGVGMWGTQHIDHFGEVGTVFFGGNRAPGRVLPQTAHQVNTPLPAKGLQHLTIAYWMPWKVNEPIATVKKQLNLKHPRPRVGATFSIQYVGPKLELMATESVEIRDDVASEVRRRYSFDNGKTWTKLEPIPPSDIYYNKVEASEGPGAYEFDPRAGVLLRTWIRQFRVGNIYRNTSYWEISRDLGKTWTPKKQLRYEDGDAFDPKNPLKENYLNKNQAYAGNNLLMHSNGTVITSIACANAPGDPQNDNRSWRMGSLCFVGKWNTRLDDYEWKAGKRVEVTPDISVRGLLEPEVAELKGGRVLVIYRGASAPGPEGGNLRAKVPGRRWFSVSDDGGLTQSEVTELKYDDGTRFYSPSSISRMARHSKTGKLYWFGNIHQVPPHGNDPRFPLIMAEVDETIPALKRHTVTTIDDRDERKQGFHVQFSGFSLLENRETHDFELYLTTFGQEPKEEDYNSADNFKYTVTLK